MKKNISQRGMVVIEAMESRLLMSAANPLGVETREVLARDGLLAAPQAVVLTPLTLSVAVLSSTVPAAVVGGAPVHGSVVFSVTNLGATKATGPVTLGLYAVAPGSVLTSSSPLVVSVTKNVTIPAGVAKTFNLNVKALLAGLPNDTYTLFAGTTDSFNNFAGSPAGPSIIVAAPFIQFSETEVAKNLLAAVVSGASSPASIVVTLTNSGNTAPTAATVVDIFASTNGVIDDNSVLIGGVSKVLKIKPGKSGPVLIRLGSFPNVPQNTYSLIAKVTDQYGAVTASPATVSVVISPPFVALADQFSTPVISFGGTVSGPKSITANCVLKLVNNGTGTSSGGTGISVFLTTTGDSSGIFGPALTTLAPVLTIKPHQSKTIKFQSPVPVQSRDSVLYLIAMIVDPVGNVTYAADPGAESFAF